MDEQQVIVGRLCLRVARFEHGQLIGRRGIERHGVEPCTPAERVGREAVRGRRHAASVAARA